METRRPSTLALLGAIVAAFALIGTGAPTSASATVLCQVAKNPCPSESKNGNGTFLKLELDPEKSLFTFGYPSPYVGCLKTVIEGEVTTAGGSGVDVSGPVNQLSFGECTTTMTVDKKGTFSIRHTSGNSGTLTLQGLELTDGVFSGCTHTGATLALTGGEPGSAAIASAVTKKGACPETITWTAQFKVVKPTPLYVSES